MADAAPWPGVDTADAHAVAIELGRAKDLGAAFTTLARRGASRLLDNLSTGDRARRAVLVDGRSSLAWRGDALEGACEAVIGADDADAFIVLLPDGDGQADLAILDRGWPGLAVEAMRGVGLPDAAVGRVQFAACNVADSAPRFGATAAAAFRASEAERMLASATAVVALAEESVAAVGTVMVERDLLGHQVVRHQLAELSAQVRLMHALAEQAWRCFDSLLSVREHVAGQLAILVAAQAPKVLDGALQLLGGHGYMAGHWLSRSFRETRSLHLLLGSRDTDEAQPAPKLHDAARPPDLAEFEQQVAQFTASRIVPNLAAWQQAGTVPRSLFADFGAAGYFGLIVPRAMGGAGRDLRYSVALVEAMMDWRLGAAAVSLMLPANTICPLLVRYANPDLRAALLPGIIAGRVIPSLAVTEPGGSSNMLRTLRTTAEDDGDHWIIDGEKIYITNGPIADVVFVLARTRDQGGPLSMTLIAVPTDTPGFRVIAWQQKLGLHISPTGHLGFTRCRVPKHFTVGNVHHGYVYCNDALTEERLLIAAGSTALAGSCMNETIARVGAAARRQLAVEMARMEACRALCRALADARYRGDQSMQHCWLAKFAVCEAARAAVAACDRLLLDPRERPWIDSVTSDARVLTIFAGASDIMRDLYATRLADRFRLTHESGGGSA
jgi:alkylation response protein AidB-like acyl-CoA dehydrogenase